MEGGWSSGMVPMVPLGVDPTAGGWAVVVIGVVVEVVLSLPLSYRVVTELEIAVETSWLAGPGGGGSGAVPFVVVVRPAKLTAGRGCSSLAVGQFLNDRRRGVGVLVVGGDLQIGAGWIGPEIFRRCKFAGNFERRWD